MPEYIVGQVITDCFAVRKASIPLTAKKAKYLSCILSDGKTDYSAKQWDYNSDSLPQEDTVIKVDAVVKEFEGRIQLNITNWVPVDPAEVAPGQFIPKCPINIKVLLEELRGYIAKITDTELNNFVRHILNDIKIDFQQCPAAYTHHHAYLGGLLEHTVGVCKKAFALGDGCNTSLLIAGAILHDIGKIHEYEWRGCCSIKMTVRGKLHGHIAIGNMMLNEYQKQCPINQNTFDLLLHMLLSHHGKLELGSPVVPHTLEAYVLHAADAADAVTAKIMKAHFDTSAGQEWTSMVYGIGNAFYIAPMSAVPGTDTP